MSAIDVLLTVIQAVLGALSFALAIWLLRQDNRPPAGLTDRSWRALSVERGPTPEKAPFCSLLRD